VRVLAFDLSSKTGWALLEGEPGKDPKLIKYGQIDVPIKNFNVNNDPNKQPEYPYNIIDAGIEVSKMVMEVIGLENPDLIIAENTVKGRNRHTQRYLEFLHFAFLMALRNTETTKDVPFIYLDPSEWRKRLNVRLTKEDKKNNGKVYKAKKTGKTKKELGVKGKITVKHVSVRVINRIFGTKFIVKDNNISDAIGLGAAAFVDGE